MAPPRPNERVSCRDDVLRRIIIIIMISKLPHFEYNQHSAPAAARVVVCKCAQINCWQIFPLCCRCAGVLVDGCSGNFAKLELELRPAAECSPAQGNTTACIAHYILGQESKAPLTLTVNEKACPESHCLSSVKYEKEIRNWILRVVLYVLLCTVLLYVGSETAWHCLYCKMQRKKLGWARVCVTV